LIEQLSLKPSGYRIEGIDGPVSLVANQQAMAEYAKVRWNLRDAPRRVQERALLQVQQQPSLGIKDCEKSQAGSMGFVVTSALFLGKKSPLDFRPRSGH